MYLCAICKLNLTVWRGQKASIKEQKAKRAEIKMIVWNNGARYLARSSVQWAKKRGVPHCVKWNRTVWSAESKVNTQNCCVYFWIGLFVFHLPTVVSRIGKPKKKIAGGDRGQKDWWGGLKELWNALSPLQSMHPSFWVFFFGLCRKNKTVFMCLCPVYQCCRPELCLWFWRLT